MVDGIYRPRQRQCLSAQRSRRSFLVSALPLRRCTLPDCEPGIVNLHLLPADEAVPVVAARRYQAHERRKGRGAAERRLEKEELSADIFTLRRENAKSCSRYRIA